MDLGKFTRRDTLFRQLAVRLLLAIVISGVLALALGAWFFHLADAGVTAFRLGRAVEHARNEFAGLEFRWGREAYNMKSRLEFSRILEDGALAEARLRSFLVAQGGYLDFPLVRLVDAAGGVRFDYSAGGDAAPPVAFGEGEDAAWAFDRERAVLYRVFRVSVWYGSGNASLLLFRPIDNALLLRTSDPDAGLAVFWAGRPVASSEGGAGIAEAAARPKGAAGSAEIPWLSGAPDPQPRATVLLRPTREISQRNLLAPLLFAGGAFALIAWLVLGRCLLGLVRRLAALERSQQVFVARRGMVGEVAGEIGAARAGQTDEVARLATALETMMREVAENERTLRESEFFFRESQRIADIGSYSCDFVGGVWKGSEVLERILGIAGGGEHTIAEFLDRVHPDDQAMISRYLADEVIGAGTPFDREYRIVRGNDGASRWVAGRGALGFDEQGRVVSMIGTIQDITERKSAEERLALAGMVFESATEGIVVTDRDNRIIRVNPKYEAITGYAAAELLGRDPKMLSSGRQAPEFYRALWQSLATRSQWTGDLWNLRKDGSPYLQRTSIGIIRDAEGRPFRHVSMIYDVTEQWLKEQEIHELNATLERRVAERTQSLSESNRQLTEALVNLERAQNDLVRAEKLAALGAIVAGVAHEMNTPIGNSLTVASTLGERGREIHGRFVSGSLTRSELGGFIDAACRAARMLESSMQRAHELVANFKQVAVDQTSENRRRFDLASIVEENLLILRPGFKRLPYQIVVKVPKGIEMDSYPGPLGQVVSNMIGNAMQHAFEGRAAGTVELSAEDQGERVVLIIRDDGIGMDEHVKRRAFDPFFTTKFGRGGTGLGLHIVFNIVTGVLGGSIELDSEPGRGSRFIIGLPRIAPRRNEA